MSTRTDRIRAIWHLSRLAAGYSLAAHRPGPRMLAIFVAALAASGLASIPVAVASPAASAGAQPPAPVVVRAQGEPTQFVVQEITGRVDDLVFSVAEFDGALVDSGGRRFRLAADVLFAFDKADLSPKASQVLAEVGDRLERAKASRVRVDGYTDAVGEAVYNLGLSQRRAEAVADRLRRALGAGVEVAAYGHGEENPIATNDTKSGQARNRRVTVTVEN